jgi:hypothetical protein
MTAAEIILKKALVSAGLNSRDWNGILAAFRNRAFFSSEVVKTNILAAFRAQVADYAARGVDIAEARKEMRKSLERLGYAPKSGEEGTIKDLYSKSRLNAIIKMNTAQARGFIRRVKGMTPGAFAAFPAQEFTRTHWRKEMRKDWPQRWRKAGGKLFGGKMIALKTDPVWERLSVFGNPYPPFDWGSGMGVVDIGRDEAIKLGLITREKLDETVSTMEQERDAPRKTANTFNDGMQATINADEKTYHIIREKFGEDFGDLVRFDNGVLKWRPEVLGETLLQKKDFSITLGKPQAGMLEKLRSNPKMQEYAKAIEGKQLTVDQTWRDIKRREGGTHLRHFIPTEKQKRLHPEESPLTPEEMEMLPVLWRDPDRVIKLGDDKFLAELDAFDGSTYMMQIKLEPAGPKLWTFFKTTLPTSKKIATASSGRPSRVHPPKRG